MARQIEPKLPIFITILLRARIYYIGIMRSLRVGSLRMQFMSKSSVLNYLEDQPTDFSDLTVGKFLNRISLSKLIVADLEIDLSKSVGYQLKYMGR